MWQVIYYTDLNGNCEIVRFIENLKETNQEKILAWIEKLEEEGPTLPRPFADILKDGIHELRVKLSGNQVRVLYFFVFKEYIILTHSFIKKSSKLPDKELNKALKVKNEFSKRFKTVKQFVKYLQETDYD